MDRLIVKGITKCTMANQEATRGLKKNGVIIMYVTDIPDNISDQEILSTLNRTIIRFEPGAEKRPVDFRKCGDNQSVYIENRATSIYEYYSDIIQNERNIVI